MKVTAGRLSRTIVLVAVVINLSASLMVAPGRAQVPPGPCGVTTLDATIQVASDGTLECGPGQEITVREEFVAADPARSSLRKELASFYTIADVQLADEESPARGEALDPCGPVPGVSSSAFRPHESMVIHLLNAHVQAAARVAATGGPALGSDLDFLIGLGDLADNQQYNEIRWIIDILDGGRLIDPDSGDDPLLGGDGYDGVQGNEPAGAHGRVLDPIGTGESLLDLANEPFWARGLRIGGEPIPWYSIPGNHDVKVQGTLPDEATGRVRDDMKAWRIAARRFVIGNVHFVHDAPPDQKQDLCEAIGAGDPAAFAAAAQNLLEGAPGAPGREVVPADQKRMLLYRSQQIKQPGDEEACVVAATGFPKAQDICRSSWIDEHRHTSGVPVGHGYGASDEGSGRCTDADGNILARACYAFDHGLFRNISLDSNPPEGLETGNIDTPQFEWLERELIASSSSYYDENGRLVANPQGRDRLVVIYSHHTIGSMHNEGLLGEGKRLHDDAPVIATNDVKTGDDLVELLKRFPNVVLHSNGHTHENRVYARGADDDRPDTGYWEVNTSAIADRPHQSRVIEIADNTDGTLSIFGTVVDAAVPPDPADIDWAGDDPTHELELAPGEATRNINEDWLASYGREVGFYDPQTDLNAIGKPQDRNVELLLRAPAWLQREPTSIVYTGDTSGQVGQAATVSAMLSSGDGEPIQGMTIAFARGDHSVTAVTGRDGSATTSLKISGPIGSKLPITISFNGTDDYLPYTIDVPFDAGSRGKG